MLCWSRAWNKEGKAVITCIHYGVMYLSISLFRLPSTGSKWRLNRISLWFCLIWQQKVAPPASFLQKNREKKKDFRHLWKSCLWIIFEFKAVVQLSLWYGVSQTSGWAEVWTTEGTDVFTICRCTFRSIHPHKMDIKMHLELFYFKFDAAACLPGCA